MNCISDTDKMQKFFIIAIFFWSFTAYGKFEEIKCEKGQDTGSREHYATDSYSFMMETKNNECVFGVKAKDEGRNYRSLTFFPNGHIMQFSSFQDSVSSTKLSGTTGSKSFYIYPLKQKTRAFRNENNDVIIVAGNGDKYFFDGQTGLLDESKSDAASFSQKEKVRPGSLIMITKPKRPMITFPYRQGGTRTANRNAQVIVEHNDKVCKTMAKNIFNYKVQCRSTGPCPCPVDNPDHFCSLPADETTNFYKTADINGIEYKSADQARLGAIINKACPEILTEFKTEIKREARPKTVKPVRSPEVSVLPESRPVERPRSNSITIRRRIGGERKIVWRNSNSTNSTPKPEKKEVKKSPPPASPPVPEPTPTIVERSGDIVPCKKILEDFFKDTKNKEALAQYLNTQGKISMFRVAWLAQKTKKEQTKDFELEINLLIEQRNPKLHKEFLDNKLIHPSQKLLASLGYLKTISNKITTKQDQKYTLKYSDVKMLELISLAEKNKNENLINPFINKVNNLASMLSQNQKVQLSQIEFNIDRLQKQNRNFLKTIQAYLDKNNCTNAKQFLSCRGKEEAFQIINEIDSTKEIVDMIYQNQYEKDLELKDLSKPSFKFKIQRN